MKIKQLNLFTSNIDAIDNFYSKVLGFETMTLDENEASYSIGASVLKFSEHSACTPYHFAINIPSNKISSAHHWLSQRVALIPDGADEIVNFKSWNAQAIYFYDIDRNIVELIARKNLNTVSVQPFSSGLFCELSEIGLVVHPIKTVIEALKQQLSLKPYIGESERFTAMGTETGLFICIDPQQKKWYPPMDDAYSSPFNVVIENDDRMYSIDFDGQVLTIKRL